MYKENVIFAQGEKAVIIINLTAITVFFIIVISLSKSVIIFVVCSAPLTNKLQTTLAPILCILSSIFSNADSQ